MRTSFYRAMHVVLARGIAIVSRPSVRPSVTLMYRGHIGWTSQRWKWVSGSWVIARDPLTHDEITQYHYQATYFCFPL